MCLASVCADDDLFERCPQLARQLIHVLLATAVVLQVWLYANGVGEGARVGGFLMQALVAAGMLGVSGTWKRI
jgi:hypothetical protein